MYQYTTVQISTQLQPQASILRNSPRPLTLAQFEPLAQKIKWSIKTISIMIIHGSGIFIANDSILNNAPYRFYYG